MTILLICILIAVVAVAARFYLFNIGYWYGDTASKMASLAIAGLILLFGAFLIIIFRAKSSQNDDVNKEPVAVILSALVGLAVAAYSAAELLAPNTPVAATAPACSGAPVYGAKYYALTVDIGAISREGPGHEFEQSKRYQGKCTLGFDGFCLGEAVNDMFLSTAERDVPDIRWLIIHGRNEMVSAAVVLSQTRESDLGDDPRPDCTAMGGRARPRTITDLRYEITSSKILAGAPEAASVGFALLVDSAHGSRYHSLGFASNAPEFSTDWSPAAEEVPKDATNVYVAAAVCLASGAPSRGSLQALQVTHKGGRPVSSRLAGGLSEQITKRLENIACVAG
ncbi:hypothetical protein [Microbispora rosea]|uniref:hypothetical protein n=1 Tax=Microbispora rosea TaxID=58117 RepID=UPI003D902D0A